jgi:hypothetical protein
MSHPRPDLPPHAVLLNLANGQLATHAIAAAANLKIADILKDGPRSAQEIAELVGAHDRSTYRLLRALASIGVLEEQSGQMFSLTTVGDCLRTDLPGSLSGAAKFFGAGWHTTALSNLLHSVKTGESAFEQIYGEGVFEWLSKHKEEGACFNEGMTGLSKFDSEAVARAYDFAGLNKIADLGGGHGLFLAAILSANPGLSGLVYDLPGVVDGAKRVVTEAGLNSRCEVTAGDFFKTVPAGYDAYILKYILHDWDDDSCVTILKHCAKGLNPKGRVLVVEQVIPPNGEPSFANLIDLAMLTMTTAGRERTESEYVTLFAKAGLTFVRTVRTDSPASVIEASIKNEVEV